MANDINLLHNILVARLDGTLLGPCVYSQEFDNKTLTNMDVVTYEVTNGAKIREALPFGMFAEVIPMNFSKSKLVVKISPHASPNVFNILKGYKTDKELNAALAFTEQLVSPNEVEAEGFQPNPLVEYQPIDEFLTRKITSIVPYDALNNYVLAYSKRIKLDLPRVLKSVAIVWNESREVGQRTNDFQSGATGTSYTISGDNSDNDSSSVSLMPEVRIEYEDLSDNTLYATAYAFYLPMPATEEAILAKLSYFAKAAVTKWPVFKTRSHTIALLGQSARVQVKTDAGVYVAKTGSGITSYRKQQGTGDDVGKNLSNGTVQIPPCIHGEINFSGLTSRSASVSATASSPIYSSDLGAIAPTHSREVTIEASVSPTSLSATSPAAIPTAGLYLIDSTVQPYEYGYAKVYAEVFNASSLV